MVLRAGWQLLTLGLPSPGRVGYRRNLRDFHRAIQDLLQSVAVDIGRRPPAVDHLGA